MKPVIKTMFAQRGAIALLLATGLLAVSACKQEAAGKKGADGSPLKREIGSLLGQGRIEIVAEPGRVMLDRDLILTIRTSAPSNWVVTLPSLADRLQGFEISGDFDRDPSPEGRNTVRERNLKLTPKPGAEYRLAPMAVSIDIGGHRTWIRTAPLVFESRFPLDDATRAAVGDIRGPLWIKPGWRTALWWLAGAAAIAAAAWGAWRMARHIRREIKLRRMSPRERALFELEELVGADLIGRNLVKDFYFELTMIVRRYIERAHAIRAPEQTTEEFMEAVSRDPRFTREVVKRLRDFLQAADLVKYAAYRPEKTVVEKAYAGARNYIETDDLAGRTGDTADKG